MMRFVCLKEKEEEEEEEEDESGDTFDFIITVSDPAKMGDGMGAYIAYTVSTKTSMPSFKNPECTVKRRFSDFLGLGHRVSEKYTLKGCIVPPAPEKSVVGEWTGLFRYELHRVLGGRTGEMGGKGREKNCKYYWGGGGFSGGLLGRTKVKVGKGKSCKYGRLNIKGVCGWNYEVCGN